MYVVLIHCLEESGIETNAIVSHRPTWASFADLAVGLFILLSGYCLTLPSTAPGSSGTLTMSYGAFLLRRARRILPPYFAALGISMALCLAVRHKPDTWFWSNSHHVLNPGVLLSHLTMTFNLLKGWVFAVDYPMWSVATEWQIYFVFPLLLWMRARGGSLRMMNVALLVTAVVTIGSAAINGGVNSARLDFLSLFAVGVNLAFVGEADRAKWSRRLLLASIPVAAAGIYTHIFWDRPPTMHLLTATLGAGIIFECGRPDSWLRGLLQSRPLTFVGAFSYSLYLIHAPMLGLLRVFMPNVVFVGLPAALVAGYLFFLAFERPLLGSRRPTVIPVPVDEPVYAER